MSDLPIAKKSLGQHWLEDTSSLEAMVEAAKVKTSDTVLEIGPGTGTLTQVLLDRGANVIAVEKDEKLASDLARKYHQQGFTVISGDILGFDFSTLPVGYKLVANIPYYLTSNLIRILSETAYPPQKAVLLMQKEVAERLAAVPGNMSVLSVTAQYFWQPSLGAIVPAAMFTPPPKVDSQVLIMDRRNRPLFDVDQILFFRLVKAGFSQKRKTLTNALSGGLHISRQSAIKLLEAAAIVPTTRAQNLSLKDWHNIYIAYSASDNS